MKEVNMYEQLLFLVERQEQDDTVRDQDYDCVVEHRAYRGILLNSGHALVACSANDLELPRFYILEPGH